MNALDRARNAYRADNTATKTPSAIEYEAFLRATRRLSMADGSDVAFAQVAEAVYENRRLWIFIASVTADPGNRLPDDLRAQLLSLAGFVSRHSGDILGGTGSIDALIEINTAIMQGLRAQDRAA